MEKVSVDFSQNVPQYACTSCHKCTSVMGKSLCDIKNRGCCWYFPKFTLVEIHRMVQSLDGLHTLNTIISNPETVIYQYYIHSKGYFDKERYYAYLQSDSKYLQDKLKDHSILFRACPFVKDGQGCILPSQYRSHVCNFFLCDEIIDQASKNNEFQKYLNERLSYARWINWENNALEHLLISNNMNLVSSFDRVIELLQSIPTSEYEFPMLGQVEYDEIASKGA